MKYFLLIIFISSISYLGFVPSQNDFVSIVSAYLVAFAVYFILIEKSFFSFKLSELVALGIVVRVILLFSFPNLSDDIYRFIWDGRCLQNGLSPFQYLPSEIVGKYEGLDSKLLEELNSPSYYSIYPPVGQFVNYISTIGGHDNLWISSFVMKLFVLFAELGTMLFSIKLLRLFNLPESNVLIYSLNPLVIVELMGNIHHEAFMVFFLVLFIYFLSKAEYVKSGVAFAVSIMSKLLPLMFIPLLLFKLKSTKKILKFGLLSSIIFFVSFSSVLSIEIIENLRQSIGLYVNKFEFNASIYYALRWIGYQIKGFNTIHIIGPILSTLTVILVTLQAFIFSRKHSRKNDFVIFLLIAFTTYLILATIVHPWYLSVPLVLCLFTQFRFPVLWSLLIMLTYINYSGAEYHENLWVVGLEYIILYSFIIYEFKTKTNFNLKSLRI